MMTLFSARAVYAQMSTVFVEQVRPPQDNILWPCTLAEIFISGKEWSCQREWHQTVPNGKLLWQSSRSLLDPFMFQDVPVYRIEKGRPM